MKKEPLVSIICLSYNHERFVSEAINSVLQQTYQNIELIVVDDASTDGSIHVIRNKISTHKHIRFLFLEQNLGNCRAFNKALNMASGEYIIDLAADDVLLPERVREGIMEFEKRSDEYGVNFTNAELINEDGTFLKHHYPVDTRGKALKSVPEGDLFEELLGKYFISPPTMMYRRKVLDHLGGYDENLTYEDFDFWIRSSRRFRYCYTDKVLVKKREVRNSRSQQQYRIGSKDLHSTFVVMKKALGLVETESEKKTWKKRTLYEMRKALEAFQINVGFKYFRMLMAS